MQQRYNYVILGIILLILSIVFYYIHYVIFQDSHHLLIFLIGDIAFVPIEVLMVSLVIHHLLTEMEKKKKMEKMNMVIGTFFSEVGTKLLTIISDADPKLDTIRKEFIVDNNWNDAEFKSVIKSMKNYDYMIDIEKIDLQELAGFMVSKRDFLLRLLENPNLLEHETFTELLRAVFHMTEEFTCRNELSCIPNTDMKHLEGDIKRVYVKITLEWFYYMRYLKDNYPYLFSLAMRTNPFDTNASPIVS
jgi:hypothetical protein